MTMLDLVIALSCFAAAYRLIVAMRRHAQQKRLQAALDAALAPQPLKAKYACVMSADEMETMNKGRWD
jgi:hypothetical protein